MKYSRSLKDYRDWHNTLNHAIEQETAKITRRISAKLRKEMREEGRKEGREEGREEFKKEIARKMLNKGMDINSISELSGLTIEEINDI